MVHAIKMGWVKPELKKEETEDPDDRKYYLLWGKDDDVSVKSGSDARDLHGWQ